MEEIKSMTEELRGQRGTSLLLGYVMVLALMFVAFEYTQREIKYEELEPIYESAFEEDMIPITTQKEQMAPPPAAAPKVAEILNIVDDETELAEEEVQTSEEVNQAISTATGDGAPTAVVAAPAVGPVREESDDDRIFEIVEENAQFPGGDEACYKWLYDNIKYPAIAQEQGIQGRVFVRFVVNKDGSIVDVEVTRSPDPSLSKEAERVIKLMPKWRPARQGNKPVRSRFNLPVMFKLQ
ncbi:MAG: energy transducer TonB [Bacteroidaceae bacterium]|nr:energy transducer TonB [Bacteroidaceae bacterium]